MSYNIHLCLEECKCFQQSTRFVSIEHQIRTVLHTVSIYVLMLYTAKMYCISYQHVAFIYTNRYMGIATYDSKYFCLAGFPPAQYFYNLELNSLMCKQMEIVSLETLSVTFSSKRGI